METNSFTFKRFNNRVSDKNSMSDLFTQQAIKNTILELCHSKNNLEQHLIAILSNHHPRQYVYKQTDSIPAGVLIPIFFKNDEAHLLFTKRTNHVEHHKGQISFPGGRQDDTDGDLLATTLRETHEEVGIRPEDVQIIGQTDQFLTNTNFLITPYLGIFPYPYPFKVNNAEIEYIVETPLSFLLRDDIFEVKPYSRDGYTWQVHFYHYENELIWGVTGFLLSNFLSIAFGLKRNIFNDSVLENEVESSK